MEAEARLRAKGPGHYLLRLSSIQVDEYILSVLNNKDQVRHLLVPRTRRNDLISKNPTLQNLADVVQFIVSTFIGSDGQTLFQFQLNEEEVDTEMVGDEMFYDANVCLVCHDQTDSPAKLKTHMYTHGVVFCQECGTCHLKNGTSSHKISCSAKKTIVTFQCELCDYKTQHKHKLIEHRKKHEDGHLSFICDVQACQKAFKTCEQLMKHKVKDHKQYFACNHCDKQFTDSKRRDKHVKMHSKLKCDQCDYECQYPSQLKKHQQTHNKSPVIRPGPKLHQCTQCKYQTVYKSNFKRHHRLRHTPRPPTMLTTLQMWEIISRKLISLSHGVDIFSMIQTMAGNLKLQ